MRSIAEPRRNLVRTKDATELYDPAIVARTAVVVGQPGAEVASARVAATARGDTPRLAVILECEGRAFPAR
eukprot:581400-Lingulodinium_polyedra.AAC.1